MDVNNFKAAQVASMLGVSRAAVYDLRRRQYLPKLELANRIEQLSLTTGGPPVPASSWSKYPTRDDLDAAAEARELALTARSTRRLGPHGTLEERQARRYAERLPPASVILALAPDFDEEV